MRVLFEQVTEQDMPRAENGLFRLKLTLVRDIAADINPNFKVHSTSPMNIVVLLDEAPILFITQVSRELIRVRRNDGTNIKATPQDYEQIISEELTNYKV